MKNDEDGSVVMWTELHPVLTLLYRNCSVLFSTARWAEPKLGMRRPRFENNGTMYLKASLLRSKTKKSSLQTRSDANKHYMKEEDTVIEIESTASSTLSKKDSTAIEKLVKEMDLLCVLYNKKPPKAGRGAEAWHRRVSE